MVCSFICCGACCSAFSVLCVIFLGGLASFAQESGERLHINPEDDGFEKAYDALVSAIYGYLACLVTSVLMYIYGLRKQKQLEAQNQESSLEGRTQYGSLNE